jgi:hypothetical protein
MRSNVLPVLEQFGVDLVLTGHSHSYERSMLIDGHYGRSGGLRPRMILDDGSGREGETGPYVKPAPGPVPHAGAVFAVVGVSGEAKNAELDHPVMYTSRSVLGSMVIDIDGNRLDATQIDNTGATVDNFTIVKAGAEPAANSAPAVSIATPADGAAFNLPAVIRISASASDTDGRITRVDFYAGGKLLGRDTTEPFEFVWRSASPGSHMLTAVARDDDGGATTSLPRAVTVSGLSYWDGSSPLGRSARPASRSLSALGYHCGSSGGAHGSVPRHRDRGRPRRHRSRSGRGPHGRAHAPGDAEPRHHRTDEL